jgi:hypothetical protein
MSNRLKFRKYLVLAACFLIMAVSFSIINNITSLFIDPVTKHLRLSISSFSFVFTIGAITTALMSPIIGLGVLGLVVWFWVLVFTALVRANQALKLYVEKNK